MIGKEKNSLDVEEGTTIRDAIEEKLSPDSYGVCGGTCSCGTCHIYVDPNDFKKLKNLEENEVRVLETLADKPNTNSRLACQVELEEKYNNITVTIGEVSLNNLFES